MSHDTCGKTWTRYFHAHLPQLSCLATATTIMPCYCHCCQPCYCHRWHALLLPLLACLATACLPSCPPGMVHRHGARCTGMAAGPLLLPACCCLATACLHAPCRVWWHSCLSLATAPLPAPLPACPPLQGVVARLLEPTKCEGWQWVPWGPAIPHPRFPPLQALLDSPYSPFGRA